MKIQSYRDLIVWQKSRELTLLSYKITQNFPSEEKFALSSQIRRAAASIPANIAEGFGRSAAKDKEHFYKIALGSLYELDTHLQIAADLEFISQDMHVTSLKAIEDTGKLLNAFITSHKRKYAKF